ncbi:TPA: hypothetical protein N0F65_002534 [Lagenidium giganteum]|uniref:PH domain-containing protein n=1 Tax=Lagenidium giganteum TaxID=4803 RepID=A0AAV2YPQ6_9STRA|nr:TPA: hypothetical protein N0F65_002534 [Lagenidium giganteum]
MYRDGYLVKCGRHSADNAIQVLFCVFGEGVLSFYSEKGGHSTGQLALAGHVTKVRIEKAMSGKLPHRFSVSIASVLAIDARRVRVGAASWMEFAAPSNDLMKEWANALHLWRRMSWKDGVRFFESSSDMPHEEQRSTLHFHMKLLDDIHLRRSCSNITSPPRSILTDTDTSSSSSSSSASPSSGAATTTRNNVTSLTTRLGSSAGDSLRKLSNPVVSLVYGSHPSPSLHKLKQRMKSMYSTTTAGTHTPSVL